MSIFSTLSGSLFEYPYSITDTATMGVSDDIRMVELLGEINRLKQMIEDQEKQIQILQEKSSGFTNKQLKILIQKIHPDKNNGSPECTILFKKLLDIKNGKF